MFHEVNSQSMSFISPFSCHQTQDSRDYVGRFSLRAFHCKKYTAQSSQLEIIIQVNGLTAENKDSNYLHQFGFTLIQYFHYSIISPSPWSLIIMLCYITQCYINLKLNLDISFSSLKRDILSQSRFETHHISLREQQGGPYFGYL